MRIACDACQRQAEVREWAATSLAILRRLYLAGKTDPVMVAGTLESLYHALLGSPLLGDLAQRTTPEEIDETEAVRVPDPDPPEAG
jgi:hypothetical protein